MTTAVGPVKANALDKFYGLKLLDEKQITEVVNTIWGDVPKVDQFKALTLCKTYHLNPLLKQIFIVGYAHMEKGQRTGTDYEILIGITANRQMALEKSGPYEYLQDTPRAATDAEQIRYNGEVDKENLVSVTFLRSSSGKVVHGIGWYPKNKEPKGVANGNTRRNMANIHSERAALEKLLPPDDNLKGVGVADEKYEPAVTVAPGVDVSQPKSAPAPLPPATVINTEATVVSQGNTDTEASDEKDDEFNVVGAAPPAAEEDPIMAELGDHPTPAPAAEDPPKNYDFYIWIKETVMPKMKWTEKSVLLFVSHQYQLSPEDSPTLADAIGRLTMPEQTDDLERRIKKLAKEKNVTL